MIDINAGLFSLNEGEEMGPSRIDMNKAPFIIHPLEPDEVERNGRKVMTVRFDGYPLPEIKWYHDSREIQQTNNILINNFKNESTLVIVQCSPNEVGKYEARAMNESGEARSSATLRLKGNNCYPIRNYRFPNAKMKLNDFLIF